MKALEPIWTEKPETAGRVRGRIGISLDWATAAAFAVARTRRAGAGISKTCCQKKRRSRRVEHHAALPYAEIGGSG